MSKVMDWMEFSPASDMGFGLPSHPAFAFVLQVVAAPTELSRSPSPKVCDQHASVVNCTGFRGGRLVEVRPPIDVVAVRCPAALDAEGFEELPLLGMFIPAN